MNEQLLSIGETAELLGVSIDTVRRWDREGLLTALRPSPKSNRYFRRKDIEEFLNIKKVPMEDDHLTQAKKWASSLPPAELSSTLYCETSDVFNARLENAGQALSAFPLVIAVTGEIGNNSYNHNLGNWPDVPGTFFGYSLKRGRIVLADRGRGILTTLKRVLPKIKDDQDALRAAFTQYVSGRAPENRGNGLKFVKDVVLANPISLQFFTGGAALSLSQTSAGLDIRKSPDPIQGCLAVIGFSPEGGGK